jgi:hypothetical protein
MQMMIKRDDFLDAIKRLESKKPVGRGKKAYLTGQIGLSLADKTAIFRAGVAKVTCPAEGVWDGEVCLSFPIALSLLKVPPADAIIKIDYLGGRLSIGPIKTSGALSR